MLAILDLLWPTNPLVYGPIVVWFCIRPLFTFYSGKRTHGPPRGFLIWIPRVFLIDSRTILTTNSLEAYLLLRFQKFCLALCVLAIVVYGVPLGWVYQRVPIPLRVYRYGRISFYNVPKGWNLLLPTLLCILYTVISLYAIVHETYFYHRARDAVMLRSGMLERVSTRTVLFKTLTRNIYEDDIRDELGAADIEDVLIQCDTTRLEDIFYQVPHFRGAVERGLLRSMRHRLRTGTDSSDPGPAQCLQWLDFMWNAVILERMKLEKDEALETGFVFVLFRDFRTAMKAYLCNDYTLEPIAIGVKPRDLLYDNFHDLLPKDRLSNDGWRNHLLALLVPVAFYVPFSSWLVYLAKDILSRVTRDVTLVFLALCMRWLAMQGLQLRRLQRSVVDRLSMNMLLEMDLYTIFLVCGGFFDPKMPVVLHDITNAIYIVAIQADLLIFVSLTFALLAKAGAITPREIWESRQLPKNNLTVRYKTFILALILIMTASPIVPLIGIGCFLFLVINYFYWKYNLLYVFADVDDSFGFYHGESLLWLCRCAVWGGPMQLLSTVWVKHNFAEIIHKFMWRRSLDRGLRADFVVCIVALAIFVLLSMCTQHYYDFIEPLMNLHPCIISDDTHRLERDIRDGFYSPRPPKHVFARLYRFIWPDYATIREFVNPRTCPPAPNLDAYLRPWEEMDPFPIWLPEDPDGIAEEMAETIRDTFDSDDSCVVGCGAYMDRKGKIHLDEMEASQNDWLRGIGMRDA
ncbi:hypothetical protein P152DRAFT_12486 [Eremomyces bilateralis CBS 781.70]|uniref:DUF221-domain-containing protein n=1 Tax=Eremomyces bilateralis CBS 781.70 TaxID=1392243 RepID=A0A6G1GH73_9PEZI|nr:uncharacterized protein P152DRAFT_12486 [Eremomyces bilateralis CBS 781.70]KAF1817251.1 hypothetical protein P152DRAFT_12486 [Eremomyces bilateralis CBS 781.70]